MDRQRYVKPRRTVQRHGPEERGTVRGTWAAAQRPTGSGPMPRGGSGQRPVAA